MKNKAREILEEYADSYSEFNVESLAIILEEIRKETAMEFSVKVTRLVRGLNFLLENEGRNILEDYLEKIDEYAAEYGVEMEE